MSITRQLIILFLLLVLSGCSVLSGSPAMSVSASSDGRYVISAHRNQNLYLWNIEEKRKQQIARNVNIHSAYFVAGGDAFIWQDQDNQVHAHSVQEGKLFTHVLSEPVYGHLMTRDLQRHISSDIGWGIYLTDLATGSTHTLKNPGGRSFLGFGKVLNLSLSEDEQLLLMAGSSVARPVSVGYRIRTLEQEAEINNYGWMNGVAIWSLNTLKPLVKLEGNSSKTHAVISPDGQWVVSGDERRKGHYWNTSRPDKGFRTARYHHGIYIEEDDIFDKSGLIDAPSFNKLGSKIFATHFIHGSHYYLHVTHSEASNDEPFAVLFRTGNPWPIKYFELGTSPWPSTREYSRNLTVTTAPDAGILVTGQHSRGGINVYRFDAENLTLERIWVGL